MTDPHFSFLNFLITFPLVRRVSSPDVDCCRAAAAFPITFSRTRPQFLLPAIHPADWGCARHQRVCPGRDRRRIPTGLTVDDRSERRNICVRARAARAQSPRCTSDRCYRIIGATIAVSCAIRTRQVSDGPAALLVSRALRLVRGLRCESSRPSPAPALASHPRFPSAPAALRR